MAGQEDKWGFSSQPVHVQSSGAEQDKLQQDLQYNESDSSPHYSDTDESLCCCPSLSDLLTSCSDCCCRYFCCCRPSNKKPVKYSKVNYSYLQSEKSFDVPDSAVLPSDGQSLTYKPVFQFPQEPQQFPTHPALPFKPKRIELQQPQMKFSPGSGTGRFVLSDTGSPFPAPYLQDHGPGMQTPYTEVPVQRQPRAFYGRERGRGSVQLATAISQRKQRSRGKKYSHGDQAQSKPRSSTGSCGSVLMTSETTDRRRRCGQGKTISIDEAAVEEDEEMVEKRKSQGRQMSLPISPPSSSQSGPRGRTKLFLSSKKLPAIGGFEGEEGESQAAGGAAEDTDHQVKCQKKHRSVHRARTVGCSPSRQPSIDPEKYRSCQTPDYTIDEDERSLKLSDSGKKMGLALRKCKTPDVNMMSSEATRPGGPKRQSDSPETEESSIITATTPSPGDARPMLEDAHGGDTPDLVGEEAMGGASGSLTPTTTESIVTRSNGSGRRRWGSRRDKSSRRSSGQSQSPGGPEGTRARPHKPTKRFTLPSHISTSPTSQQRHRSSLATDVKRDSTTEGATVVMEDAPFIYFSLYFDIQRRALTVNLIKVENLPRKPPNQGSCDPFVMMFLLPNKQEVLQSVIKQRTLNPEFQQVFEFGGILANDLKNQVLVFRVFGHDRFSKNDLIGTVIMPLKDADLYGMLMRKEVDQRKGLLKQFSAGDLLFSLTYSADRKVLNGIILKATNLRKADIWGLADPYVKVYLIHDNKRLNKWKTDVKKNTLVPIYNESFQFDLTGLDMRNVSLEVWIMDYDWFSRNDKMGVLYVGANSPQEVGRSHWLEILSAPEHQTSHWHTIIPYTDLKQVLPLAKQQQRQRLQQKQKEQQQKVDYLQPPPTSSPSSPQLQSLLPSDSTFLSISHDDSVSQSNVSDKSTL